MSTEIVLQTQHAIMPAMDIPMAVARYDMMKQFVSSCLVDGQDFGMVPGTSKNTLFKPGAEKLMSMFGLAPSFEAVEIVQDWTGKEHGETFLHYWFKCKLHRGGQLVGEGEGSCNSWESKYRWRWVPESEMVGIPTEGLPMKDSSISEWKFAVDKAQTNGKYGKPVEYWNQFTEAKRAGTMKETMEPAPWGDRKPTMKYTIPAKAYRLPNPDIASVANTILKMAQKRALVAATLIATNASDYFTQDLEDMDIGTNYTVVAPQPSPPPKTVLVESLDDVEELPFTDLESESGEADAIATGEDMEPYFALFLHTEWALDDAETPVFTTLRNADKEGNETTAKAYGAIAGRLGKLGIDDALRSKVLAVLFGRVINKNSRMSGPAAKSLYEWLHPETGDSVAKNLIQNTIPMAIGKFIPETTEELWTPEHGVK